jgi:hypothetical protein
VTYPRHTDSRQDLAQTEPSEFQKDTGQPLFAVVEELVAEILFEFDIASQQRSYEFLGKARAAREESSTVSYGKLEDAGLACTMNR